jgi:hypothetical protein
MGARELLERLRAAGFGLEVTDGGRLAVRPASRLTDEQRAAIRAHRDELAAALRRELAKPADPLPEPAPRYRAWRARFPNGKAMTVLHPPGMDHAEALAAVDRWPGMTVEPILISEVTP